MAINEPIYKGLLQSDLDVAGFNLLNYAGAHGIPAGGTVGQSLTKIDGTDYNAHWSTVTGGTVSPGGSHQVTATELLNSIAGTRTPIASLAPNTGNWFDSQTYDPCVLVNPSDSTQLIMFFSGMGAPVATGLQQIGRATASVADPTTWTVSNSGSPVITPTLSFETGGSGLRADSVLYNAADGKIYLFYTAKDGSTGVGLATSTDLGLTWTKLGLVLTPTAPETYNSQMAVFMEGTTLHAVYAYRTVSATLPAYRYATATTTNWLSWTKGGVDVYSDPSPGRYHEFHQLFKIFSTYVLCYESGSGTVPYDIRFATSTSPASGWVISPVTPFFQKSGVAGTFDRYHVATANVAVINGFCYLIYCGAIDHDQPYGTNHWQMGVTPLLTSSQVSQLYIGTDLRIVSITGGGKLQARNPATNTWVDADSWTNP